MQIIYLKGKKSRHGFMPFGDIIAPETVHQYPRRILRYWSDSTIRFYKRENSLKAILRRIRKQNFDPGTVIRLNNWYVGYADILIQV